MLVIYTDGSWYVKQSKSAIGVVVCRAKHCPQNSFSPLINEFVYYFKDTLYSNQSGINEFLACLKALELAHTFQNENEPVIIINDNIEMIKSFRRLSFPASVHKKISHLLPELNYDRNLIEFRYLPRSCYGMTLADSLSKITQTSTTFISDIENFTINKNKLLNERYDLCPKTEKLQYYHGQSDWFSHLTPHVTITDYLLSL